MYKISPTKLESFRLYRDYDWMSTERLIDSLVGEFVPTPEMDIGTDYHLMLEGQPVKHGFKFDLLSFNQWQFKTSGVNEVRLKKQINVNGKQVLISSMCDVLDGLQLHENKTSFKPFQAEKYTDSMQWRCYLHIFDCPVIHYHVYKLAHGKGKQNGLIVTQERNDLTFYKYENMVNDINDCIEGLIDFCDSQAILDCLIYKRAA